MMLTGSQQPVNVPAEEVTEKTRAAELSPVGSPAPSAAARSYWPLCLGILTGALALRLVGFSKETLVFYDEMRPDVEGFLSSPIESLIRGLGNCAARPGFLAIKTLGVLLSKALSPHSAPGTPVMPLGFQIVLDIGSIVLLMHLVYRWLVVREEAKWPTALWAGLFWAASPVLIRYSHRMLPPTYALFVALCFYWILFWACSRAKLWAFFFAGLAGAVCFLVYPGLYYLLLMSPLLLMLRRVRAALSTRAIFSFGTGALLLPVALQAFMMVYKWGGHHPNYLTYLGQIRHVGTHILHGDPHENMLFPVRFLFAGCEFQWVLLLGLLTAGLVGRRYSAWPWIGMLAGIYAIWVINGPILNREVLYGRTVVLTYPLAIIAASLTLVELWPTVVQRTWLIGSAALLLLGVSGMLLVNTPVYRYQPSLVQAEIGQLTHLATNEFDLITEYNDYGTYAQKQWTQLNQTFTDPQRLGTRPLFVAFNLRYISSPCYPQLETRVKPLLCYPSPVREPTFQFEGLNAAERKLVQVEPGPYDVKVYRVEELVRQPHRWLEGNQPSWIDRWKVR
jgi:hypothetical protein